MEGSDPSNDLLTMQQKSFGYGHISGVKVGQTWVSRVACSKSGLHRPSQAGIHSDEENGSKYGAYSVVLSGGYEDDVDSGDKQTFTYSGAGGKSEGTWGQPGRQTENQSFKHPDNFALERSSISKWPVRVVRAFEDASILDERGKPAVMYRYDGLYQVNRAALEKGKSGYDVCKFYFSKIKD